jgi:hypothetical protein
MALQVAVIGPGESSPEESSAAETIGALLARRGAILVCGGLGGVMEAACRGAVQAGGLTVGIIPHTGEGNPFVRVTIRTGLSHARNIVVVQSADTVIAVGGAYGTLSEIAIALKLGKPVFGFRTWDIPGVQACTDPGEAVIRACAAPSR